MKKNLWLIVLIIIATLASVSFTNAARQDDKRVVAKDSLAVDSASKIVSLAAALYSELQLQDLGLSQEAMDYAVNGYEKLQSEGLVNHPYLTIVDFSQSSRKKRFYIIDVENRRLVWNTFVSHGKNSGVDMATNFSNAFNSEASSLGFYVTKGTYMGKHGLSLRISGQEEGFNNNAEARGVVVHGAPYVNAGRVSSDYMGRSQGCPALPENEYAAIINIIKDGSVMFLYAPSSDYLQGSQLIKG